MAYHATSFEGIVVDSREIAWIKGTHIKVLHIAYLANGGVIDVTKIRNSFRTLYRQRNTHHVQLPILDEWQVFSALAYFERNRELCEKHRDEGEGGDVYRIFGGGYRGFYTPAGKRCRLLQGSRLRKGIDPLRAKHGKLLRKRQKWIDDGMLQLEDGSFRLIEDLPPLSKTDITELMCGFPNAGNKTSSKDSSKWEQLWPARSEIALWHTLPPEIEVFVGSSAE